MKIQKGMVKYKDRNDIICMYGVTDGGKTYYFLDNTDKKVFSNGNRIVSTELVEAIDPMYKCSKIGVIDAEGNEVIPCENKAIKQVLDDIVLVEKTTPTTESVLQAIEYRNDSLHAAQLVSTPAQIKDNIYREMGTDGRFLFNDQFNEATIYDINGNNLINDEVYSFIAVNNNQLYLSKNLPDSPVNHFSLNGEKTEEVAPVEETTQAVEETQEVPATEEVANNDIPGESVQESEEIDVNAVNVPMDVVENALDNQGVVHEDNVIQENFDIDTHAHLENENEGLDIPSPDDFMATTNLGSGIPVVHEDDYVAPVEDATTTEATEVVEEDVANNAPSEALAAVFAAVEAAGTNPIEKEEVVEEADEAVANNAPSEALAAVFAAVEAAGTNPIEKEEVVDEAEDAVANKEPSDVLAAVFAAVEAAGTNPIEKEEVVEETEEAVTNKEPSEALAAVFAAVEAAGTNPIEKEEVVEEATDDILDIEEDAVLNIEDSTEEVEEFTTQEAVQEKGNETVDEHDSILAESDIQSLLDETSMDLFGGTSLHVDSIDHTNFNDELDNYTFSLTDDSNLFDDVAKSMTSLIKLNREQRATIANYEDIIDGLNADKAELNGKVSGLEHQNVELSDRNRALENAVMKLKTRIEKLAATLHDKDEIIAEQEAELTRIRPQLEGKAQLLSLLKDAQSLIGNSNVEEDIDDYGYIKRAA